MVAGRPLLVPLALSLPAVTGCNPLDRVPVFAGGGCAPERVETVACVYDGDTFRVGSCDGESIRMLGINAPELQNDEGVEECWAGPSANWLQELLTGAVVTLRFDEVCTDAYDRTLAYVYVETEDGDPFLVNEASVREGQSRVYEDFDDILLADLLYSAQDYAQRTGAGLWGECQ